MSNTILSILVVSVIALMVPWILLRTRTKIPFAAAEILLGVAFGRSGLGWIRTSAPVSFLSLFGLSYIMFLYGLETNIDSWIKKDQSGLPHSQWLWPIAIVWLALGFLEGFVFRAAGLVQKGIAVSLLLGSSAPTVLLPTLKERGLVNTSFGQWILSIGLLVDFTSLLGVTALAALNRHGAELRIFLVLLLFVPILITKSTSGFLHKAWFGSGQDSVTGQIGVRGVMMIITLFIALAETLGTVTVLGAFLAGIVVSMIVGRDREILQDKLDALGFGYFIPFFFVTVGANLNLRPAMTSDHVWILTALFLCGITVISLGISPMVSRLFPRRHALAMAALLATRLSVTVAGSLILYQAHIISDTLFIAMIITSVLSAFIFPPIFHWLSPPRPLPRRDVLLIGSRHWTLPISSQMTSDEFRVHTYEDASEVRADLPALGQSIRVIALLGAEKWEAHIVCALDLQESLNPEQIIIDVPSEARSQAEDAGLLPFVAALASMQLLETMIRTPLSGLVQHTFWSSMVEMAMTNPQSCNIALKDLKLPEDTLVIGIARQREHIVPRGSTRLQYGDTLTIVCPKARRHEIREIFESPAPY